MHPMAGRHLLRLLSRLFPSVSMCRNWRRFAWVLWWPARVCWMSWSTAVPAGRSAGWYVFNPVCFKVHSNLEFWLNRSSVARTCLSTARRRIPLNGLSSIWRLRMWSAARTRRPWSRYPTHSGRFDFHLRSRHALLNNTSIFLQCGDQASWLSAANPRWQGSTRLAVCYQSIACWADKVSKELNIQHFLNNNYIIFSIDPAWRDGLWSLLARRLPRSRPPMRRMPIVRANEIRLRWSPFWFTETQAMAGCSAWVSPDDWSGGDHNKWQGQQLATDWYSLKDSIGRGKWNRWLLLWKHILIECKNQR